MLEMLFISNFVKTTRRKYMKKIYLLIPVLALAACAHKAEEKPVETAATPMPAAPVVLKAQAALKGAGKDSKVKGVVHFTEENGKVSVEVIAEGLKAGPHGFHIHEGKDCTGDFSSAGGHFNPTAKVHGAPDASAHHAGDLGNIVADKNKKVQQTLTLEGATLTGTDSLIGKTVIIHQDRDDLKSQPAGNSGKRIACGVVEAM
jgi:Cu-Zn family superoxide dismutase